MMRKKLSLFFCATLLTLCAASLSLAQDTKITTRMSMNGQPVSESTTYIKGTRKRTESKMGMQQGMDESVAAMMPSVATVYQCDRRRMLQINDKARKYTVTMLDEASASAVSESAADISTSSPADTRQGGLVTYTMNITDTGQRQEMFGFRARYLKISATVEPGPGACATKSRFEQEGWFIDFQADLSCSTNAPVETSSRRPSRQGCQDRYRFRYTGAGKMGYPLSVTTTYYDEQGKPFTMKQEVVDLQRSPQDPALFDVPTGYTQASSAQELYAVNQSEMMAAMNNRRDRNNDNGDTNSSSAMAGAKRPGTLRVGVIAINNKTDKSVSTESLRGQLIGSLNSSNLDAVALNATSPSEAEAEARQKQCDFVLYTDIASLKQASAAKKIGGIFGRATGVGSGGIDKTEARIDYRLIPVGGSSPQIQSSATAKEEGDEQSASTAIQQEAQNIRSKIKK